ncbi:MAG: undecaprenyl-diphosphate phosphatase [Bacilli bacterium]|nr:undecaprenyl-diphosphate phosphatase [Bacilli bacterium]
MMIIELIKSVIFGIVEGITEWLPISSTGHMILLKRFLSLDVSADFWEVYLVVIQLGAILAVCTVYFKKLNFLLYTKNKEKFNKSINIWKRVIVGCIPAAVIGFLLDDFLDKHFYNFPTVALMLIIYGILFIIVENYVSNKNAKCNEITTMSYKLALYIGLFQVLALIPGTSRSGATILGALIIGTNRTVAAEFTFYLAVPVMAGASLLKLVKFGFDFSGSEIAILLTGMIVAYIVSIIAIKFLLSYIKKHDFKPFGVYRIALGLILLLYYFLTIR